MDDVVVAGAMGARANALQIGAGSRFGHGNGTHTLAAGHRRQVTMLLRLGAVIVEIMGDDAMHRGAHAGEAAFARSEEHTSELQSLMRNSYAVFCLQKKK